jgi:hypothetical protein
MILKPIDDDIQLGEVQIKVGRCLKMEPTNARKTEMRIL